jgi:hypothetical protein
VPEDLIFASIPYYGKTGINGIDLSERLLAAFNDSPWAVFSLFNDDTIVEYPFPAKMDRPAKLKVAFIAWCRQKPNAFLSILGPVVP